MVASPLCVHGVVYSIEMGGGLAAVDTVAGKSLYRRYLDGYNRYNRFTYGVAASPTLAGGKNLHHRRCRLHAHHPAGAAV